MYTKLNRHHMQLRNVQHILVNRGQENIFNTFLTLARRLSTVSRHGLALASATVLRRRRGLKHVSR